VVTPYYDIAIIGGGIHGVGAAQAAAAAGYSAVLLEKTDLGTGTSSRSSKLIHGGLRYLESGQFSLVRESLRERRLLLELASTLVHPLPFYIPISHHARRRPWKIRLGLLIYAILGGLLDPLVRFRKLKRNQWSELEGLQTANLSAVFEYWDAQTDDAELTRAVMHSAQILGAHLLCPAELVDAVQIDKGYRLRYRTGDTVNEVTCGYLINAAGPWANYVLQKISPAANAIPVDLVQGTHIVVSGSMHQKVFYLEAPIDGRAVFVMPWKDNTSLVGTTEHLFNGDPDDVMPLETELSYLRNVLRHYFPSHTNEILRSFSGLRVLPKAGSTAFHRSRETILHVDKSHPRLLTIYGGKLTTYRSTARKIIQKAQPLLGAREKKANTEEIYLTQPSES